MKIRQRVKMWVLARSTSRARLQATHMKNYLSYGHYSTLDFRRWRTVDGCFKTSNGYVYVPACVDTET